MTFPRRSAAPPAILSAALLVATAIPAAHATITPGARRVVERYLEAIGGRRAFESQRSIYVRGKISAFGMSGSVSAWHQRPDRRLTRFELGPLVLAEGFDGTIGWRTDPGGKFVRLDGKDLEEARFETWLENNAWLEPDQAGGAVAEAGTERDSLGTYHVLEVRGPVAPGVSPAKPQRLWFDDRTGLLVRTVAKKDQQTIIHYSSDYRPAGARRMAFQGLTRIEGMPANDVHFAVDSVDVNPEIPLSRFGPPTAAGGVRWLKVPGLARLPFEYASRHVWLKASVNGGPPADFLFDTGASLTVLDSTYAERIGVRTVGRQQGVGAGALGGASFASVNLLRVAAPDSDGVELSDLKVAVVALDRFLEPYFWRPVAGVLGFDFIQRFVDEIDFDAETLELFEPKDFDYEGKGDPVPMKLAGTTPVVMVKLDSLQGEFRVDVGSGATVDLHTPFVQQHHLLDAPGPSLDVTSGGFGGTFRTRARRMRSLTIGPFTLKAPIVGLSQAAAGAFTSEDYAGNLGNQILERFNCTFDYERRVLYLAPGRRFADPDVFPRSGVQLARFGDRVEASVVLPDSPAARAGVREGDEVVAIDGRPLREWTPDQVAEALDRGPVGSSHTLELARAGQRVRVSFVLRELL